MFFNTIKEPALPVGIWNFPD